MNEKLQKLAKKLYGLIGKVENPQDVYKDLTTIAKKQPDYFTYLGPHNYIKLVLYIYSYITTKDFKLGDKMINNLSFMNVLYTDGELNVQGCDQCGGDGTVNCDYCGGEGDITCRNCTGDGYTDSKLNDNGKVEFEECEECHGDGLVKCNQCDGDGDVMCDYCEGDGEITSESDYDFMVYLIVSWDKDFKNLCELREGTKTPIMSLDDFNANRDKYIDLSLTLNDAAPLDIIEDEFYCIGMYDEPKILFNRQMFIIFNDKIDLEYLY